MSTNLNVMEVPDEELDKVPDQATDTKVEEPPAPPEPEAATPPVEAVEDPPSVAASVEGGQEPPSEPAAQAPAEPPAAAPQTSAAAPGVPAESKKPADKPSEDYEEYKSFYQRIVAPIKGGGKTVEIKSADEAISLMQMGLDYTRKNQQLGRYKKFGMMLENHGLLDEGKLDLLISVHNKDPEAIRRFFKQNKLDPVEIDTTVEDKYKEGANVVSDSTAKLQTSIDDLSVDEDGQETLRVIKTTWDADSREVFRQHPELLGHIHKQRVDGVYAKVVAEVERRQALGQMPGVPFIHAYREVGNELQAQGKLGGGTNVAPKAPAVTGGSVPGPVARRTASHPASTTPGKSAARAAAATRTTPKAVQAVPNPLAGSDEEFEKA